MVSVRLLSLGLLEGGETDLEDLTFEFLDRLGFETARDETIQTQKPEHDQQWALLRDEIPNERLLQRQCDPRQKV